MVDSRGRRDVGQYLYGCYAPWVRVDERKQILAEEMPKLYVVLREQANPTMSRDEPPRSNRAEHDRSRRFHSCTKRRRPERASPVCRATALARQLTIGPWRY